VSNADKNDLMGNITRPTQRDVARLAGVSRSTVALALGGFSGVAAETHERVRQAARELGYSKYHNFAARRLIAQRQGRHVPTGIFCIFGGMHLLTNPFFSQVIGGIEEELGRRNLHTLLTTAQPNSLDSPIFRENLVDGIAWLGDIRENDSAIPSVLVADDRAEYCVLPDDLAAGRLAAEHLISLGHRDIAMVTLEEGISSAVDARLAGMREVCAQTGLSLPESRILRLPFDTAHFGNITQTVAGFIRRNRECKAMVAFDDLLALRVMDAVQSIGIEIPRQLSIVGFNGLDMPRPGMDILTSIYIDAKEIGRLTAEMLCDLANGVEPDTPIVRIPVRLQKRASTAAPAGMTKNVENRQK